METRCFGLKNRLQTSKLRLFTQSRNEADGCWDFRLT